MGQASCRPQLAEFSGLSGLPDLVAPDLAGHSCASRRKVLPELVCHLETTSFIPNLIHRTLIAHFLLSL